jgi:hypothetical protein
MKTLNNIIKGAALSSALLFSGFASAQQADYTFSPSAIEVYEGESFETQVIIETGNVPFTVFDLHLAFESEYLQVMEMEVFGTESFNYHVPAEFSNVEGRIDAAAFRTSADFSAETFLVANITFAALAPTELTEVKHITEAFPRSIVAYGGEDVSGSFDGLEVTIVGNALSDGIEDGALGNFNIWPNPAKDMAQLSFELNESKRVTLEVFSAEGKLIDRLFEGEASAGIPYQFDLDVNHLATGNYTCRLMGPDGVIKAGQLTVTH